MAAQARSLATAILLIGLAAPGVQLHADESPPPARPFPQGLSGALPYDVDQARVKSLLDRGDLSAAHGEFDILAWQAFIALNWPAGPDGQPSNIESINNTSLPRVWEYWRPSDSIFLPDGGQPAPWDGALQVSTHYRARSAWRDHTNAASNLEAFSGPLVDQNGEWVRYQIRVNQPEFNYIYAHHLYNQQGQIAFSDAAEGNQVELPVNDGDHGHGAIEIKLAWKQLGPGDDPKRFFTKTIVAQLSEPPGPDGKIPTRTFLAGLVGMHISMRTQSSPEWIWSTFEQIDNVRQNPDGHGGLSHANFFNPTSSQPTNVLPTPNAVQDPDTGVLSPEPSGPPAANKWIESLTTTPVQAQRVTVPTQTGLNPDDARLHKVTEAINAQVQRLLGAKGSVFQYYELIDAQWPVRPNAPAFAGGEGSAPESIRYKTPGHMVPVFLVNTTMETYFQKGYQPAGSLEQDDRLSSNAPPIDSTMVTGTESCSGCHYSSGVTIGFKHDPVTGKIIVDKNGVPTPIYGENNHFGKTGNASFSWMLQQEPKAMPFSLNDPNVIVK